MARSIGVLVKAVTLQAIAAVAAVVMLPAIRKEKKTFMMCQRVHCWQRRVKQLN
jgi:hypothetical protein